MSQIWLKIFRYELLNILRNRWIFVYAIFITILNFLFIRVSGNIGKAILSLSSVCSVLIPLVTILFTTIYSYYSESFLALLLTQPVKRSEVWWARNLAIILSLSFSALIGVFTPFLFYGTMNAAILLLGLSSVFLTIIFSLLGFLVASFFNDKMLGVGFAFFVWLYAAIIHDSIVLIVLMTFKDYPLETAAGIFSSINPLGLVRVAHIIFHDASLLLGLSGAVVRKVILDGRLGFMYSFVLVLFWLIVPAKVSFSMFKKKNF